MKLEGYVGKFVSILKYYTSICLIELREITKTSDVITP
jgi:hypothetical protein